MSVMHSPRTTRHRAMEWGALMGEAETPKARPAERARKPRRFRKLRRFTRVGHGSNWREITASRRAGPRNWHLWRDCYAGPPDPGPDLSTMHHETCPAPPNRRA